MTCRILFFSAAIWLLTLVSPGVVFAHCDTLDGPVVRAAQRALDSRNVTDALIWVQPADETEVREAFDRALAVRDLNDTAKALADRYFFETVVRLHRSGEGAPYTGVKPAGPPHPAIFAADQAIAQDSLGALQALLVSALQGGLRAHFDHVMRTSNWPRGDVAAGRESVKAYVEFVHYVERLHEAIEGAVHGHFPEGTAVLRESDGGQGREPR
jgi:uncharacterized protein DUF6448